MTAKQKKFCEIYAMTGSATKSAIDSGYSVKSARQIGQKLLTKLDIQAYIKELSDKLASDRIMQAKEMQERLTALIRGEEEEEVLMTEGCGDGISQVVKKHKKASFKDKVKAIHLLAKMQGVLENNNVSIIVPVFGGEDNLED